MTTLNPELQAWAEVGLELGFDCFEEGDHVPFILLAEKSGRRHLTDLKSTSGAISEALLDAGRGIIQQFGAGQYYALIWDGFLTTAGKRQDAVFAEVGMRGERKAYVLAQRYHEAPSGELARDGQPLIAAEALHLWGEAGA